jgi:hypothetical protein
MKIILDIIIISIFCNGWYLITRQGMLFFFLHDWYLWMCNGFIMANGETEFIYPDQRQFQRFFYSPLFGCVTCMASIYGTIIYLILNDFSISWLWPITIIASSYMNLLLNRLLDILYKD